MTELKLNESLVTWKATSKGIVYDDGNRTFTVSAEELTKQYRALERVIGKEPRFYGMER